MHLWSQLIFCYETIAKFDYLHLIRLVYVHIHRPVQLKTFSIKARTANSSKRNETNKIIETGGKCNAWFYMECTARLASRNNRRWKWHSSEKCGGSYYLLSSDYIYSPEYKPEICTRYQYEMCSGVNSNACVNRETST